MPSPIDVYARQVLDAIGEGLSENDQLWLSQHFAGLPAYLKSDHGRKVMAVVVDCYRASMKAVKA